MYLRTSPPAPSPTGRKGSEMLSGNVVKASPPAPLQRGEGSEMLCGNELKASPPAPLQRGEGSEMLCEFIGEEVKR